MLEAVLGELRRGLEAQGINALCAYPNMEIPRSEAVVALSVKKAAVSAGGFGDYLGMTEAGEAMALVCDAQFSMDIYSDADGGMAEMSRQADRLIGAVWALSGALGPGALTLGQTEYDRNLCCLRCRGELGARFWLLHEETAPEIEKFTVKGMILHGDE
ncbi:MAG: hypothetical protein ACOX81_02410 [Candidatus Heteroscillospira sp.]|jgi:hypothetical protein